MRWVSHLSVVLYRHEVLWNSFLRTSLLREGRRLERFTRQFISLLVLFLFRNVLTTTLPYNRKCDALSATLASLRQRAAESGLPAGTTTDNDSGNRMSIDRTTFNNELITDAQPMAIDDGVPAGGMDDAGAASADEWDLVDLDQVWKWAEGARTSVAAG